MARLSPRVNSFTFVGDFQEKKLSFDNLLI
jgi:hypothetical protein